MSDSLPDNSVNAESANKQMPWNSVLLAKYCNGER